jgi:alpha-tubulin suppressor-like RCC1 family protein
VQVRAELYSCGSSPHGALGLGEKTVLRNPERISGISKVLKIAVGEEHCAALVAPGKVFTWGNAAEGVLGLGEPGYKQKAQARQTTPKRIETSYTSRTNFIDIACGKRHTVLVSGMIDIVR